MPGDIRDSRTGTYNQTVGVKLDMDDAIEILTPDDVPLQRWVMTGEPATQVKVQWLEEDLTPQHSTVVSSTGAGPWVTTVAEASIFRPGDVLLEKDNAAYTRQYVVTTVDAVANEIGLTGFAGNTTAPGDASVLEIIGQYRGEGSDPEDPRSIERVEKYNYTQIGQEQVSVTRTARKRELYGQEDPYDHEVGKKFKELAIRFERSMVNGVRTLSADATKRFMGGLFYYISTNSESGAKANILALINALLKKCYEQGGAPRVLMVSPSVKSTISGINADLRRTTFDDRFAGSVVEHVRTDFGEVDVVMNRHFPKTKGLVLQHEFLGKRNFDPYFHEMLAKTGDSEKGEIVGEFTLQVKNENAHGVLTVTDA